MSHDTWSNILLNWSNSTGFAKQHYLKLTKTDIEAFFAEFRKHIHGTRITQTNLISFLKDYYPAFELNVNEYSSTGIGVDDFVYVYSLLLHFSCVKYPEADIQKRCSGLENRFQQCIAVFFTALIKESRINRKALEDAIKNSSEMDMLMSPTGSTTIDINSRQCGRKSVIKMSPCVISRISSSDSSDGNNSGGESSNPGSPRAGASFSPLTPRTKLLDNWKLENKNLKAELETERYERSFLESQIQELEEKINNINQERTKYITDIQDLKSKLLIKDTENVSPNGNVHEEQIRRRLRKEIADKEEQIITLQIKVDNCNENNDQLKSKLKLSENTNNKLNALVEKLNDSVEELQKKIVKNEQNLEIQMHANIELQEYINELKSSSGQSSSLDSSVECFDSSSSAETSTNSVNNKINKSPENLCKTVVDVQLREQQLLNQEMKETLKQSQAENTEFLEKIKQNMIDIKNLETRLKDSETELLNSMEHRNLLEKDQSSLTDEIKQIKSDNDELLLKLEQQFNETNIIKLQYKGLLRDNEHLLTKLAISGKKIDTLEIESHAQKSELQKTVEQYQHEKSNLLAEIKLRSAKVHDLELKINEMSIESDILNKNLSLKLIEITSLNMKNESLSIQSSNNLKKVDDLSEELERVKLENSESIMKIKENFNLENKTLTNQLDDMSSQLKIIIERATLTQNQMKSLENDYNSLTNKSSEQNNEIIKLTNNLQQSELENIKLNSEISQLKENIKSTSDDLVEKINCLENEKENLHKVKLQNFEFSTEINNHCSDIENLKVQLNGTESKLQVANKTLKNERHAASVQSSEYNKQIELLSTDLQKSKLEITKLNDFKSQLIEKQTSYEMRNKFLENKLQVNETEYTTLIENNNNLLEQVSQKQKEIANMAEECIDQKHKCQQFEEKILLLNEQLNEINVTAADKQKQIENSKTAEKLSSKKLNEQIKQLTNERDLLNNKSQKQSTMITELQKTISKYEEKQTDLESENVGLRSSIEKSDKKQLEMIQTHNLQLQQNKETTEELTNKLQTKESEILNLQSKLSGVNEQLSQIKVNHENCIDDLEKANQTNQEYKRQITDLETDNSTFTEDTSKQILKLKIDLASMLREKSDLETSLKEQINEKRSVDMNLKELNIKHNKTCTEFGSIKRECSELHQRIKELENVQVNYQEEQSLTNDLTKQISSLQANINLLNNNLLSANNNLLAMETEKDQLKQKYCTIEDNLQLKLDEITKQHKNLMAEFDSYKTFSELTINNLKCEQNKTTNELLKKNEHLKTEHLKQITELKTQISRFDSDLKDEQNYNFQIVAECQTLREEVHLLNQKAISHAEENSKKICAAQQDCENQINAQQSNFEEIQSTLQNNYNQLEREMISAKEIHAKYEREFNFQQEKQQKEIQNSSQTIELLNKQINQLESNEKEMVSKNDTLLENIKQLEQTITALNTKSHENDQKLLELNETIQEITEKNREYLTEKQNVQQELDNQTKSMELIIAESKLDFEKMKIYSENENTRLNAKVDNQLVEIQTLQQMLENEKLNSSKKTESMNVRQQEQLEEIHRNNTRSVESHRSHIECLEREKERISRDLVDKERNHTKVQCQFDELNMKYEQSILQHQNVQTKLQTEIDLQKQTINQMDKQHEQLCEKMKSEKNNELEIIEKKYLSDLMEKEEIISAINIIVEKQNAEIAMVKSTSLNDIEKWKKMQLESMASISRLNEELNKIFSGNNNDGNFVPTTTTGNAAINVDTYDVTGCVTQILNRLTEFKVNYTKRDNEYQSCQLELEKEKKENEIQLRSVVSETDKRCIHLQKELKAAKDACDDTKNELKHVIAVLGAKLIKEREDIAKEKESMAIEIEKLKKISEDRVTETRLELEGKLEKMKNRMKQLYNEECAKLKAKCENEVIDLKKKYNQQEREIFAYKSDLHKLEVKLSKFDAHTKSLSSQIFQLNEVKLELIKEREFLLNKQRLLESGTKGMSYVGGGGDKNIQHSMNKLLPASSIASLIKMEDEEGELFNNTYLNELKSGCHRMENGRESVRASELMFRNSMVRPHLRSTYAAQYIDETYDEDDIKAPSSLPYLPSNNNMHDESFAGSQSSDVRRGTLYQKPGPPTPSKNGGRLSFGGGGGASSSGIGGGNVRLSFGSGGSAELRSGGRLSFGACVDNRDVLKENKINVRNCKNTPGGGGAKWSAWFTSSSSTARGKDENSTPKRKHGLLFKKAR